MIFKLTKTLNIQFLLFFFLMNSALITPQNSNAVINSSVKNNCGENLEKDPDEEAAPDFRTEDGVIMAIDAKAASIIRSKKRLPTPAEIKNFLQKEVNEIRKSIEAQIKASLKKNQKIDEHQIITKVNKAIKKQFGGVKKAREIIVNPELYYESNGVTRYQNGRYKDVSILISHLSSEYPGLFEYLKSKIHEQALIFFRFHMVPPTFSQLSKKLGMPQYLLKGFISQPAFWDDVMTTDLGRHIDYARKRLTTAYARALRGTDTPTANRTRKIEPTLDRLIEVLILTKSNEQYQWRAFNGDFQKFDLSKDGQYEKMKAKLTKELQAMLGEAQVSNTNWVFKMPKLYDGLEQLKVAARAEYQPTFTSFEDIQRYPIEYAEKVKDKIMQSKKGILISSHKPGNEIEWPLLESMMAHAKDEGYEIVIIPSDGMFQDIDPKLLELVKEEKIHLLTETIENDYLRLWLYPSNDRAKAFGGIENPGMFKIGQTIIVPHHTMAHKPISTAQNTARPTKLYSTGTIDKPNVKSVGKSQKAKAEKLARSMKRGFSVVSKGGHNTLNDNLTEGTSNSWNVRPVEWRLKTDEHEASIIDLGKGYFPKKNKDGSYTVERREVKATHIYAPDTHYITAEPRILEAFNRGLQHLTDPNKSFDLVEPDSIENRYNNAHVEKKQKARLKLQSRHAKGQLDAQTEINDSNSNDNILLTMFPNIFINKQYDNHSHEWIDRNLINNPSELQQVINGALIDELRFAVSRLGVIPLEYLIKIREEFLKSTALDGDESWKDGKVFISDPSRIRVIKQGEPLMTPQNDGWSVAMQHHGHQGANGSRGSPTIHAKGEIRSITGDSHQDGYLFIGELNVWVSVGNFNFEKGFTLGGNSGWGQGLAVVYPNGTVQHLPLDPQSLQYVVTEENQILPPDKFFGDKPLEVNPISTRDQDQNRRDIDSKEFKIWFDSKIPLIQEGIESN